jgi:hypothetical protein
MSRSTQEERASDWQAVQAREAHRGARLFGPLPSSRMREELTMLHSTSRLSSCVNPCLVHGRNNAAEPESHGNYGPLLTAAKSTSRAGCLLRGSATAAAELLPTMREHRRHLHDRARREKILRAPLKGGEGFCDASTYEGSIGKYLHYDFRAQEYGPGASTKILIHTLDNILVKARVELQPGSVPAKYRHCSCRRNRDIADKAGPSACARSILISSCCPAHALNQPIAPHQPRCPGWRNSHP